MEIFWLTYLMPKFGSEKEYDPKEYHLGVETNGGEKDARAACKQYHKNCKITAVEPYTGATTQVKQLKKGKKK